MSISRTRACFRVILNRKYRLIKERNTLCCTVVQIHMGELYLAKTIIFDNGSYLALRPETQVGNMLANTIGKLWHEGT